MERANHLAILSAAVALAIGGGSNLSTAQTKPAPALTGQTHYFIGKPYQFDGVWYRPAVDYGYDETGVAAIYPPGRAGLGTTSGEPYDENAIAAAHKTLPLPSVARVTNLDNGKSIELRINDRGPFVDNQIIELTPGAARLLSMANQATAHVRVQIKASESQALAAALGAGAGAGTVTPAPAPVVKVTSLPLLKGPAVQPLKPVAATGPLSPAAVSAPIMPVPPAMTPPPAKPVATLVPTAVAPISLTPAVKPVPVTPVPMTPAAVVPAPASPAPPVSVTITNATEPSSNPPPPTAPPAASEMTTTPATTKTTAVPPPAPAAPATTTTGATAGATTAQHTTTTTGGTGSSTAGTTTTSDVDHSGVSTLAPALPVPVATAADSSGTAAATTQTTAIADNFRMQLAALRSEADAIKTCDQILAMHSDILGPLTVHIVRADLGSQGIYYRVEVGPFDDKASANAACDKLKSVGQGCLVKPRAGRRR